MGPGFSGFRIRSSRIPKDDKETNFLTLFNPRMTKEVNTELPVKKKFKN